MKKLTKFVLGMCLAIGLAIAFIGCASSPIVDVNPNDPASTKIDRSKIKDGESAIVFYLDPSMIRRIASDSPDMRSSNEQFLNSLLYVCPVINNSVYNRKEGTFMNAYKSNDPSQQKRFRQSVQINVPNGHYIIGVKANAPSGTVSEMLPVDVNLNNVAVIFKVREATVEEKRAAGFASDVEAYALDESAIITLQ